MTEIDSTAQTQVQHLIWNILNRLGGDHHHCYALADGAANAYIHAHLQAYEIPYIALYEDDALPEVQAPLLFPLRPQETFSQWYLQEGLGRYWGILLATPLSLAALAAHLRPYLIVQDEQGQRNLMRFYDPRVIRAYLNALTRTQGEALFKPDLHLWGDAPGHAGALMHFHLGAGHYRQEKILIHQDNKREACSC